MTTHPKSALEGLLEAVDVLPPHGAFCPGGDPSQRCRCDLPDLRAAAATVRAEMEAEREQAPVGEFNPPEWLRDYVFDRRKQAAREALQPIRDCGVTAEWLAALANDLKAYDLHPLGEDFTGTNIRALAAAIESALKEPPDA